MRAITSSIFALLLAGISVPALANPATEQFVKQIQGWEPIYSTVDSMYYMSPEDQNDGLPGHTYKTAEIFLDGPVAIEEGDTPIWGYIAVREYDCEQQTMTVKNYAVIEVDGVRWDNMVGSPAKRSEIRADEGIRFFKMACGWN